MGILSELFGKSNTSAVKPAAKRNPYEYDTDTDYFDKIITEDAFPGYTIERNVRPSRYDSSAHPSCFPVTYLFSRGGVPVLAVFIMQTNQYRSMIARGTYKILDDNAIPYIRFFKGYRNEANYVINRIKENL